METKDYDVLVVGAGTASQTLISDIANAGLKIAVVSKDPAGGVCALEGCNAKKFMCEIAHGVLEQQHLLGSGIAIPAVPDWEGVMKAKTAFVNSIPEKTIKWLKQQGIDYYPGTATFVDGTTMAVGGKVLSAKYIVLATGARPRELNIPGKEFLCTSGEFLNQKKLKKSYAFIGGGFIGAEFATIVKGFGANAIIINNTSQMLGAFDRDMVEVWQQSAVAEGINFRLGVTVEEVKEVNNSFNILFSDGGVAQVNYVVNATGRIPNIEELDLGKVGVVTNPQGIIVDGCMLTSNSNIFAIGDCASTMQLARVADNEAHVAAEILMQKISDKCEPKLARYDVAPAILFTYPQLAMVGQTEKQLMEKGMRLDVGYERSMEVNLGWANFLRVGMKFASYKMLVDQNGYILGAHILSPDPSGCIEVIKMAMMYGIPVDKLWDDSILSAYPTPSSDLTYMLGSLIRK